MSLCKSYYALWVENEEKVRVVFLGKTHVKLVQPPTHIRTDPTRNICRALVIGDSLLRGTEAPICHPDSISREVCCMLLACIHDVMEMLPKKKGMWDWCNMWDYHPFLLFQVWLNDPTVSQQKYKESFYVPWNMLKGLGAQVVFSSTLPVRERD